MLHNFERQLELKPDFESENLKVLYYDLQKGYQGTYKSYEYNRICTILRGKKKVRVNHSMPFEYTNDEFILLPPNSNVEMEIEEDTKAVVYEISDRLIDTVKTHIQTRYETELITEDTDKITSHLLESIKLPIERINQIFTSNDSDKSFLIDLSSQELVYHLIKNNYIPDSYNADLHDPINYTIQYIRSHVSENICLKELAYQLHISPSNLSTKFKKRTGFTLKEYINLLKIKKAREELKNHSVTEVCYSLGYENISYFIGLFKKQYGETPKQYSMRISKL